jgi:hypothetical protein
MITILHKNLMIFEKNQMNTKWLAVGIILLFIGVAITPSITAPDSNDKTVKFDVELCGLNQNYSILVTPQQAREIYLVFDAIKQKLTMVETQEATKDIFSEAVTTLHTIGLFDDTRMSQVLDLVLQPERRSHYQNIIQNLNRSHILAGKGNYFCSIAGNTSQTYFCGASIRLLNVVMTLPFFIGHKIGIGSIISGGFVKILEAFAKLPHPFLELLVVFLGLFNPLLLKILFGLLYRITLPFGIVISLVLAIPTILVDLPWALMNLYTYNDWISSAVMIGNDRWGSSVGWVETVGLNGNVNWNGSLWGQLPLLPHVVSIPQFELFYYYYPGIMGFRGIKVGTGERWSYLWHALWVNLDSEHPKNPWLPEIVEKMT